MNSEKIIWKLLNNYIVDLFPTGSRVICNPPVLNTDEDWILLIEEKNILKSIKILNASNYYEGGSEIQMLAREQHNYSFKHYDNGLNLIITVNRTYFNSFKQATILATKLNLVDKQDRIKLFQFTLGEALT